MYGAEEPFSPIPECGKRESFVELDILEVWSDPRFVAVAIGTPVIATVAFLAFSVPYSWLMTREWPWLEQYRIQGTRARERARWSASLRLLAGNGILGAAVLALGWPLLALTGLHLGPLPGPFEIIVQLFVFALIEDFCFYWAHRALHTPWLYRHVHELHHRETAPWGLWGNHLHPAEYLVISSLVLVGPLLIGSHIVTLWIFVAFRQWESAESHSGFDFPWNPANLIPLFDGALYHDFHHRRFIGNYAGMFSYLDRIFGTYSRGYVKARAQSSG